MVSKIHLHNPTLERRREEEQERGRWRMGERTLLLYLPAKGKSRAKEGEGVMGYLTPTTLNPKD